MFAHLRKIWKKKCLYLQILFRVYFASNIRNHILHDYNISYGFFKFEIEKFALTSIRRD